MKARLTAAAALAMALAASSQTGFAKESVGQTETVPTNSFSAAYLAGRAAESDSDYGNAITYYKRALTFAPDNADLQKTLLLALIAEGRLEEAKPYAESLQSEPEVERFARLVLAIDAFGKDDFAAAEGWLDFDTATDLDRLIVGTMKVWARMGQADVESALEQLDDLQGPDWYKFFKDYQRALLLAEAGRNDDAGKAFEKVLGATALQPMTPDTIGRIGSVYASFLSSTGDREKALEVLNRTEEAGGGTVAIAALREQVERGQKVEPEVTTPREGAAEILLNLGTELASGGGDAFVRLYLQYVLALRPDDAAAMVQLAHVAERQQQSQQAIDLYEKIEKDSPWARFAEFQIGLNLADLKKNEEAVAHLKTVLEEDPSDMRAYLALGGVYASQKDFRSAAALYDRAVAQIEEPSREHWNIFYQRGIAYERLKEWPKAEPNFKTALELFPDHPQVLNYLGYSWIDMSMNLDEGMELIRRAVELRPSDGYIVDSLGWAYYKLGDYDQAVEHLERAVSLRPEDPVLNDHLGDVYWQVGRRLEARYQWSHAQSLEPDADLLAQINRKLDEGLPEEKGKQVADAAGTPRALLSDAASPSVPAETAENRTRPRRFEIKQGQSLWSIAVDEYGDGRRYLEIIRLNPSLRRNPDLILPGQELTLPE